MVFEAQLLLFHIFLHLSHCLENGLGRTPPMGFNTWERYRCNLDCRSNPDSCISEHLIKRIADILSEEYAEFGYEYLVLDDCWLARRRDKYGQLQPDPKRFPSGILELSKYVHSKNLKLGIYGNYGKTTCAGFPGIINTLQQDAELFASWEVDFVKLDGCYSAPEAKSIGYPLFGYYLNQTGRHILYSCSWPAYLTDRGIKPDYSLIEQVCNIWRNFQDVQDSWVQVLKIVEYFATHQDMLGKHHGPGHFNDADMMVIGGYGLSYEQSKAQMALWCVMGVPLFISTDLFSISQPFKEILQNKIAIAINQDPLGKMGRRIYERDSIQIWRKKILPITEGGYYSYAYVFLNCRTNGRPFTLKKKNISELGLYNPKGYLIEDVFDEGKAFINHLSISIVVNPTGVTFLRFTTLSNDMDWYESTLQRPPVNNNLE